jgi:hypothetical protein
MIVGSSNTGKTLDITGHVSASAGGSPYNPETAA